MGTGLSSRLGCPLAPVKDKKYVRGLHRLSDRWLHITKGVGNLHGLRLNCRPEVSCSKFLMAVVTANGKETT